METSYHQALTHFLRTDPTLHQLLLQMPVRNLDVHTRPQEFFSRLCLDIIGQQLSVKAANTIAHRFETLLREYSDNDAGATSESDLITPDHVLSIPDEKLREAGLSWGKIKYVNDLAQKVKTGSLNLQQLPHLENEAVIEQLTQVKGIGRWTAEMFLIFTLGREDVFSFGDLGLKNGFIKAYQLEKWDETVARPVVEKWQPYRSYAALALWYSLDNTPNPKKNRS